MNFKNETNLLQVGYVFLPLYQNRQVGIYNDILTPYFKKLNFNKIKTQPDFTYWINADWNKPVKDYSFFFNSPEEINENVWLGPLLLPLFHWLTTNKPTNIINDILIKTGYLVNGKISTHIYSTKYLIPISYRPMISKLFSENVFIKNDEGYENHIDRTLNVQGSAVFNKKYIEKMAGFVVAIFNTKNVNKQPDYIIDMGCGSGCLLLTIYNKILNTNRGQVLDQYPITLVGIDFNKASLIETAKTLKNIPHMLVEGDIGKPSEIQLPDIVFEKGVHIRSFIDHDRTYISPEKTHFLSNKKYQYPEYTYQELCNSLVEHLIKWRKISTNFGLYLLDVHKLNLEIEMQHIDTSKALWFDILQVLSNQSMVELSDFLIACGYASFIPVKYELFPKYQNYSDISYLHLVPKKYRIRFASMSDISDLLELEKELEPNLRITGDVIINRIKTYSEGCLVLDMGGVKGVVYTNRVDFSYISNITFDNCMDYFDPDGNTIQLIFVLAKKGYYGAELLQFAKLYSVSKLGIEHLVGFTRCLEKTELTEYNHHIRNDPIVSMHLSSGAEIIEIRKNYRKKDVINHGNGILISYPLPTIKSMKNQELDIKLIKNKELNIIESIRNYFEFDLIEDKPLREQGMDSMDIQELTVILKKYDIKSDFFFENATLNDIKHMCTYEEIVNENKPNRLEMQKKAPIHVVGMACRFPGAESLPEFWERLQDGKCVLPTEPAEGENIIVGYLRDCTAFDHDFFGISKAEASLMDPQQKLCLEVGWQALFDAGIDAMASKTKNIGTFIGQWSQDHGKLIRDSKSTFAPTGGSSGITAARIAYLFNFDGPAWTVDTACFF